MGKRGGNPPPRTEGGRGMPPTLLIQAASSSLLLQPPSSLARERGCGRVPCPHRAHGGGGVCARRGRKPSLPLRAGEGMDCFHSPSTTIAATGILRGDAKPFALDASATLYSPSLLALHSSAAHFAVGDANLLLDVSPRSLQESFPVGTRLLTAHPCPASLTEYVRSMPPSLLFYRRRGGPPIAGNRALPLELRRLFSFSWSHPPPPPRSPPFFFITVVALTHAIDLRVLLGPFTIAAINGIKTWTRLQTLLASYLLFLPPFHVWPCPCHRHLGKTSC